jgi:4a-hydroxytetrahydrobiopterin dehydratase
MENWIEKDNALVKTFTFATFEKAMEWMQKASLIISEIDHHPEWCNVYNRITVRLTTHDCGNTITEKDRKLAAALDKV